jgi:hypothetical protein
MFWRGIEKHVLFLFFFVDMGTNVVHSHVYKERDEVEKRFTSAVQFA